MEKIYSEWCGNCPKKKKDNRRPKIHVSSEEYHKLLNGEALNILVDSVGEPMIEAKVIFKDIKKKSESTGWDNPPVFTSLEQRDNWYK